MPLEIDYEFGKAAVKIGLLRQDQLEECVEVLVALERVGSKQRLWDVVRRKGYLSTAQIASVLPPSGAEVAAEEDQETSAELQIPPSRVRGFVLAQIIRGGKTRIYPLPPRMVALGNGPGCDILLNEKDVAACHAHLRLNKDGYAIECAGEGPVVLVNERRVQRRALAPNDLIRMGHALLLFLADYGGELTPESLNPTGPAGTPIVRLRLAEGTRKGATFFMGANGLVIGRHALANVRLPDTAVSEFHAHLSPAGAGAQLVDLRSTNRTLVNGLAVKTHPLRDGDNVTVGNTTFVLNVLRAVEPMPVQVASAETTERGPAPEASRPSGRTAQPLATYAPPPEMQSLRKSAAPPPPAQGTSDDDWNVPDQIAVEPATDPLMRQGGRPVRVDPQALLAPRAFKPGELRLSCVSGPLEGRKFVLSRARTLLGRDEKADILIDDISASRHHAEVLLSSKPPEVRDAGSRNGVFLNDARVTSATIRPGDALRVGKCIFIVEEVVPAARGH